MCNTNIQDENEKEEKIIGVIKYLTKAAIILSPLWRMKKKS